MTTFAGNRGSALLLSLCFLVLAASAEARLTATVDRAEIALGETLRLVLSGDEGEHPEEVDLSELQRDFEILQSSSATNARFINGQQTVTRTLELDLSPLREGIVTVPGFTSGGRSSTPIAIKVSPAPKVAIGDELVYFDAKVDQTEVYVQAQVLLTITLQQAINLDNRAVSELDIDNAYVETLEQKSFQRRVGGRLWQVTELRYAVFPQQSGTLSIPAITFGARELLPGRSLLGARLGRRVALETKPIKVNVKPVPDSFPGETWLPARSLSLESSWSTPPDALGIGDSTTRRIEMKAEGLQGSQLPPITSLGQRLNLQGLKFYPDQETIEQREINGGLEGYRLQSEALVVTQSGAWELPERVIPWWNTETDQLEYARIPSTEVAVASADPIDATTSITPPASADQGAISAVALLPWQIATGLGWLMSAALAFLLWRNKRVTAGTATERNGDVGNERNLVSLKVACSRHDARAARDALLAWGQSRYGLKMPITLSQLAASVDTALANEIKRLDEALFSPTADRWYGDALFDAVRSQKKKRADQLDEALDLYPTR